MLQRVRMLWGKSVETVKLYGVGTFFQKAAIYLTRCMGAQKGDGSPQKTLMDVLFINGCYLPHPARYRVSHQREQLASYNVNSNEVFYENLTMDLLRNYRVFVFFRCPITPLIEEFVKKAKEYNKTVLFDIDDLMIDTKYTDTIPYIQKMSAEDKGHYDDGILRTQKLLKMCDAAITSTDRLAEELSHYVPEVFINRNTASGRMVQLSEEAYRERLQQPDDGKVKVGYFSGSITHNADFEMILPVITELFKRCPQMELHVVGELDVPAELKPFESRIVKNKFVNWEKLPALIASVDINLAPVEQSIFNEAKSENKWVEAALVRVPTVASSVGAMKQMIEDGETGFLCTTNEEWLQTLERLIADKELRDTVAKRAYEYVYKHCTTTYTGGPLAKFIKQKMTPNIAFVLPSLMTSGGVLVVLKHCVMLRKAGYDVLLLNNSIETKDIVYDGITIPAVCVRNSNIHITFDKCVSTLWDTLRFQAEYPNIRQRYYLVQNFETNFYEDGNAFKFMANATYCTDMPVKYITISKWCERWLKDDYDRISAYAPNGLDLERFKPLPRTFEGKIRILVEGNSDDYYKNVDESFRIVEKLDPERFEIWFMSYQGKPKSWYHVDKFLHRVPYEEVPQVYHQCHILLKSSILESFSYPPLEMMATGGVAVVAPNDGNIEYLKDGENCLLYEQGNIQSAVDAIERVCADRALQDKLYAGGVETAKQRDWNVVERDILRLYDIEK